MLGVLAGFGVIVVVIAVGFAAARTNVLGDDGQMVLNRLVFFIATPCLLLDSLARTPLAEVLSPVFVVSAGTAIAIASLYTLCARLILRRRGPELVMGAMAASYVNSANLGIPIALYVLGDLGFVAPLLLFQVCLLQPTVLAIMDHLVTSTSPTSTKQPTRPGASAVRDALSQTARNPLVIAGLLGLGLAAAPWTFPDWVLAPIALVGQLSVPGALMVFGMSLYGVRVLAPGATPRADIALVTVLKMVLQPALAYVLGLAIGMHGHQLFTVVVAACLPTAQNVLVVANRYGRGQLIARDSAVVTTVLAVPVLLVVSALLAA